MIKKFSGVLTAAVLVLGLTACNTDNGNFNQTANNRDAINVRDDNGLNDESSERTNRTNDDDISSLQTTLDSEHYPHTKAILKEHAKYEFVKVDPGQMKDIQQRLSFPGKNGQAANEQQWRQGGNNQAQENQGQNKTAHQPDQNGNTQSEQQPEQNEQNGQTAAEEKPGQNGEANRQQENTENQQQQERAEQPAEQQQTEDTAGISEFAQQVIDLTNQERANNGLPALKGDTELSGVALKKSQDMEQNNYFSHTSPTYGSPFDMMRDFGVTYNSAAENIAQGQQTPQEVVDAWMNSPGHRANILSEKFTHIGVGHEQKGNHWTQMFIGR